VEIRRRAAGCGTDSPPPVGFHRKGGCSCLTRSSRGVPLPPLHRTATATSSRIPCTSTPSSCPPRECSCASTVA